MKYNPFSRLGIPNYPRLYLYSKSIPKRMYDTWRILTGEFTFINNDFSQKKYEKSKNLSVEILGVLDYLLILPVLAIALNKMINSGMALLKEHSPIAFNIIRAILFLPWTLPKYIITPFYYAAKTITASLLTIALTLFPTIPGVAFLMSRIRENKMNRIKEYPVHIIDSKGKENKIALKDSFLFNMKKGALKIISLRNTGGDKKDLKFNAAENEADKSSISSFAKKARWLSYRPYSSSESRRRHSNSKEFKFLLTSKSHQEILRSLLSLNHRHLTEKLYKQEIVFQNQLHLLGSKEKNAEIQTSTEEFYDQYRKESYPDSSFEQCFQSSSPVSFVAQPATLFGINQAYENAKRISRLLTQKFNATPNQETAADAELSSPADELKNMIPGIPDSDIENAIEEANNFMSHVNTGFQS